MNKLSIAILAVVCLCLLGCESFPESSFELARESRLPKWFTLPSGLSRSDVTVTMDYYIDSNRRTATFILLDVKKKRTFAKVNSTQTGLVPLTLRNNPRPPSGFPIPYPAYEIVTVN